METSQPTYLHDRVSNGNVREQALIRRWWHEQHKAKGCLVWEFHLYGLYADAIWFPESLEHGEYAGQKVATRFPLKGVVIVLCEAKKDELKPALIGQALVHASFARRAGARVRQTIIFAETGSLQMKTAATDLGLEVVLGTGI